MKSKDQIWEKGRNSMRSLLSSGVQLAPDQLEEFLKLWKPKTFAKGDFLIQAGEYEHRFYFISIPSEDLLESFDRWMELERWGHRLVTQVLSGRMQREIELLQFSAKQRLERFCQRSDHLFLQIPHKHIAAYLKMSPETLSRLRAEMAKS